MLEISCYILLSAFQYFLMNQNKKKQKIMTERKGGLWDRWGWGVQGWRWNERKGGELDGRERERRNSPMERLCEAEWTEGSADTEAKLHWGPYRYPNKRKNEEVLEAMNTQTFLESKEGPREVLSEIV